MEAGNKLMMTFDHISADQMEMVAKKIAKGLQSPCVVFLDGTLGAGKTTLVRLIGDYLHLKKGELIRSPSFAIVNSYERENWLGFIHHFDFYRLTDVDSLEEEIGLSDYQQPNAILFIEWANKFTHLPFKSDISIQIDYQGHDHRLIVVNGTPERLDLMAS